MYQQLAEDRQRNASIFATQAACVHRFDDDASQCYHCGILRHFVFKFERAIALVAARDVVSRFQGVTDKLIVAGSLRRRRHVVADVEVLYVPKFAERQVDLLATGLVNLVDEVIGRMEAEGILERRRNVNGSDTFGPKNKLMRHVATGVPVDLFSATPENWFNYLVCRTGPSELNIKIAMRAQERGWQWNPYGNGFSRVFNGEREERRMDSEREVFEFVGLAYAEPWERNATKTA